MAKSTKPKRRENKVPEPVNTCAMPMEAIEHPKDSDAVLLTKELEDLNHQIENHRRIRGSLLREAEEYKDKIACGLLNHAAIRSKLNNALATPIPVG